MNDSCNEKENNEENIKKCMEKCALKIENDDLIRENKNLKYKVLDLETQLKLKRNQIEVLVEKIKQIQSVRHVLSANQNQEKSSEIYEKKYGKQYEDWSKSLQ